MLQKSGNSDDKAVLRYGNSDFDVLKHGSYVLCAMTGARIALNDLRYWNVDLQEAYVDAAAATSRWKMLQKEKGQ